MFLLVVHPAYGGRGVGRTLLNVAHDALRAAGSKQACSRTNRTTSTSTIRSPTL